MHRVVPFLLVLAACGEPPADDVVDTDAGDTDAAVDDLPAPAEPAAYSGGNCPEIVEGVNEGFVSGGNEREFIVTLPKRKEGLGVLFLWHGNGDSMANFARYLDDDGLASQLKVIVVTPEKFVPRGDTFGALVDWGVPPRQTEGDTALFDDLLSCLDQQYGIDRRRVFSAGFSAGALWTSYLVTHRADHLAAAVSFSGGTDGTPGVNPYETPAWDIPVLLTEGGQQDAIVTVNFQQMTNTMASKLRADGSTAVVCSHTQGHTPPSGFSAWAWPFLNAHRYGLAPSPYADGNDPSGELPDTCAWE